MPYPESSQGHYYDAPAAYFLYEDEADFAAAGALLDRYADTTLAIHPGSIWLLNWRNESHRSWLLKDKK